jgi:hypothetical protein
MMILDLSQVLEMNQEIVLGRDLVIDEIRLIHEIILDLVYEISEMVFDHDEDMVRNKNLEITYYENEKNLCVCFVCVICYYVC